MHWITWVPIGSTMRLYLAALLFVTAALAAPSEYEPIGLYYHENFGIAEAARIKATEEALDFDGARIVGGSTSNLGQFPFMGGLVITLANGATSVCGSSLISNTRLTTAAHCWTDGRSNARSLVVVLGSTRLFSGGNRITTNRVATHASYNHNTLHNDVAVITINHVAFNNNIRSINLASGSGLFNGQNAEAIGFGRTADNANISQNQVLRHVVMPVITNADCQRTFGAATVIASTLCTSGANGRSTCQGDSGGPLRIGNNLIGITSFVARAGCQRGMPAGFARVTSFNAWIRQRM